MSTGSKPEVSNEQNIAIAQAQAAWYYVTNMHKPHKATVGFTIVELLIVIVVIAILAAISIVAYTNIRERAVASAVKSDLANFAKKIELAKVDAGGVYPASITPNMGIEATKDMYITDRNNWFYCTSSNQTQYALGVMDIESRVYFQSSVHGIEENMPELNSTVTCDKVGASPNYMRGYEFTGGGFWQPWIH